MDSHLSSCSILLQKDLKKISNPIELDYMGIDNTLVKSSNLNPIFSCNYTGCTGIVLLSNSGVISLAHILTITNKNQIDEYLTQPLTQMIFEINSISKKREKISALIIGGSNIKEVKGACIKENITVLSSFEFPTNLSRDLLVFPNSNQVKVYFEKESYVWNIDNPNNLKKL